MERLMTLEEAFIETQEIMSTNYTKLMENIDINKDYKKEQVISYIEKVIKDNNIKVKEYENKEDELSIRLYKEMSGFSILDDMLNDKEIEEINILSWKDIEISYNNGEVKKSKDYFFSPQHCINIIKKLLSKNGMTLNDSKPVQVGYLHSNHNIRITAYGEGVFDEKLGCGASIRIVNPKNMKKEDFLNKGLCNDEMLNFLSLAFRYGISMCITGETGTGKTTLMSYIMEQIPEEKRLITMEENTREYDLHKYDENGFMTNNVVHLITREREKENENITLKDLIKIALTSDPNYMCVSEMKGDESVQAVAAANTGHSVITTTHSKSCKDTYYRMLFLSKQSLKNDISTEILLNMICSAFPIVVHIIKYPDNVRRISEVTECMGLDNNNNIIINTLYKYKVFSNEEHENKKIVNGNFEKIHIPSEKIKDIFYQNGATNSIIARYFSK